MHEQTIEKYKYLLKRFPPERRDAAKDGLIRGCLSTKLPPDQPRVGDEYTPAENFLYTCMEHRVQNQIRDEGRQKRSTKMTSNTQEKEFEVKDTKGKKIKRVKRTKEQFIPKWLYDNGLDNSMRNLQLAEDAWDESGTPVHVQPVEVSFNSPLNPDDSEDSRTLSSTMRDPGKNPEQLMEESEEIQQMTDLIGLKDKGLRSFLRNHITKGEDKRAMETKFRRAMLEVVVGMPSWRTLPTSDLEWLCDQSNSKMENLMALTPSAAQRVLKSKALGG